jgi:uncharacterized phosphosugar-binding protein
MTIALDYLKMTREMLTQAEEANAGAIAEASGIMARCIAGGGVVHAFGTGHSHMLAEEIFARARGLAAVNAILYPPLMLHRGAFVSSQVERETGLATRLLEQAGIRAGDVLIVISPTLAETQCRSRQRCGPKSTATR